MAPIFREQKWWNDNGMNSEVQIENIRNSNPIRRGARPTNYEPTFELGMTYE